MNRKLTLAVDDHVHSQSLMGNELPAAMAKVLVDHHDVRFDLLLGGRLGKMVLLTAEQPLTVETRAVLELTSTAYDNTMYLRASTMYLRASKELTSATEGEVSLLTGRTVEALWAMRDGMLEPLTRPSPLTDIVLPQVQTFVAAFTAMHKAIPRDADMTRLGPLLRLAAGQRLLTSAAATQ